MIKIEMDMIQTIGLAVILLLIGMKLRKHIKFFEKYLPEHKYKLCRLDTPIKMTKKNNKPVRWTYDINEELEQQPGEISTYYKGLGTWSADDLDYVIKHDTLEKMIVSFDFDSDEIIDDFMSDKKSDTRKEYILNNNFNIAKI